jgi:hypothetical protein
VAAGELDARAVLARREYTLYRSLGAAIVGHHDRMGLRDDAPSKSWNSSRPSRGCSQDALKRSGGDGLLYCFAN